MTPELDQFDRRRRRIFFAMVAAGGVAVVVVAAIGVVLLKHELEKRAVDPFGAARSRYDRMYAACVARGGGRHACAKRVTDTCVQDPIFKNDANSISDISDVCVVIRHH